MLVELLLGIFNFFLQMIVWVLPSWQLPSGAVSGFGDILGTLSGFNPFIPIHTLFEIIGWIILFELSIIVLRFAGGFVSFLRGGGKIDV